MIYVGSPNSQPPRDQLTFYLSLSLSLALGVPFSRIFTPYSPYTRENAFAFSIHPRAVFTACLELIHEQRMGKIRVSDFSESRATQRVDSTRVWIRS